MSRNKIFVFVALVAVQAMTASFAQTPMTIQEWSIKQAEIKRAELDNKLREQRERASGGAVPVVTARTCDDDLQLLGVFGPGKSLRADIRYRGAIVTLSPGDNADIGGWFVEHLNATRATMVKHGRKGSVAKRCPLYLSSGVRDFTTPVVPALQTSDAPVQVPPIMAAPVNTSNGQRTTIAPGASK